MYFPSTNRAIRNFWRDEFVPLARSLTGEAALFIGDFNSGKNFVDEERSVLTGGPHMLELESLGWVDAWRSLHPDGREYTFASWKKNGFRVDHAWLSPPLGPRLRAAWHSHRERHERLSDHSALTVDLE